MTFYFYDLETSGINARAQRIMQFAGQRTDENFQPIGEPHNWLIKLTDEILPDPDAILITGLTPQKTLEEGYTEAEFLKLFYKEVLQPDTVIMGFNTIRFDDEFMRATLWRNFYDPYEWQWQDGRSRWDLLDVIRMIRALRPEGIEWPVDERGQPTNRLELLTKANKLNHENAHDALSDVQATIALARLLRAKQPKIFDYLLQVRDKKKLAELVQLNDPQPFLYCSGRYSSNWHKTTAVLPIAQTKTGAMLVYDLRQDPLELAQLSDEALKEKAFSRNDQSEILPVKILKMNCCPAVAPLGVLDDSSQARLSLTLAAVEKNYNKLRSIANFGDRLATLFSQHDEARRKQYAKELDCDFRIYDGFVDEEDKVKMRAVRAAAGADLAGLGIEFSDERLSQMLTRYKARNFSRFLSSAERSDWEDYRAKRVLHGCSGQLSIEQYAARLSELASTRAADDRAQYLLQELQLWAEAVMPAAD